MKKNMLKKVTMNKLALTNCIDTKVKLSKTLNEFSVFVLKNY